MDIAKHNRKLIHYRKYVFALPTLLPFRRGIEKPKQLDSTSDLMTAQADRMRFLWNEPSDGDFVLEIAGGWCHGRRCEWIGIDDRALAEFQAGTGELAPQKVPSGWLSPRHYRRMLTTPNRLPKPVHIAGDVVVLNTSGSHNYFHWLCEVLPRLQLARQAGVEQADAYVVDNYKPFHRQALELLGISADKVIEPHEGLMIQADRLIVPSLASAAARRRLGFCLQTQAARGTAGQHSQPARRLHISRRLAKNRSLGNDAEVAALLARYDFETHCLEEYTLEDQIRLFRDASIIVGLHGAGLSNILLPQRPTSVIEIRPTSCNRNYFQLLANEVGAKHQVVPAKRPYWRGPWQCELPSLENAVNNAIASLPGTC